MAIKLVSITLEDDEDALIFIDFLRVVSLDNLRNVFARACNVWPDAPNEVKKLHDILIHGKPLQDYDKQSHFTRREELPPEVNMKLDVWASENSEAGE